MYPIRMANTSPNRKDMIKNLDRLGRNEHSKQKYMKYNGLSLALSFYIILMTGTKAQQSDVVLNKRT